MKMLLILFFILMYSRTSVNQDAAPEFADVVFLVDSSDNLGSKAFPFVKVFINKMINALPIEAGKYRIALAQYSDDLHSEFQLSTFKSKNPMLNHLKKNFAFRGGSLRLGQALQRARETYFSGPTNGRDPKQFPPVLVILASGPSKDDVEEPAKALQRDGVKIISLGMQAASDRDMKAMATPQFDFLLRTVREVSMFSPNMTQIIKDIVKFEEEKDPQIQACHDASVVDIVFLVDEAVNGTDENFEHLKGFLGETIASFDVKENCMRIGLVLYSDETKLVSLLGTGTNKSDILQQIESLSPKAGKALTGAAINVTRREMFSRRAGSRKSQGVQQVAVLITHRSSEDSVSEAALSLRREGVTVFAVGMEGANETQLGLIASYPQEQYISMVETYSDMEAYSQTFRKKLLNEIQNKVSVASEQTEHLKSGCADTEEADIYLLIDGSGSIQVADFHEMKKFLIEVIGMFNVGLQKVRFGAVQYSHLWECEFEIDRYSNKNDLVKAVENIRQLGGNTDTGAALDKMLPLFQKARQQRTHKVPQHLVVLTDGLSHDSVKEPAGRLRDGSITVYAIGVKEANQTQLEEIAGSDQRVYYVHNFDSLKDIKNRVVRSICSEEACKEMIADIMFLVDSSGSIGEDNFEKMKTFMKNVVNKTKIGANQVQVGLVQFSDINKEGFQLNQYNTKTKIFDAIDSLSLIGRGTLTGSALTFVSDYFGVSKGARPSVRKFLVLLTDGKSQDAVKEAALALRQIGVIIYSVGVFGSEYSQLQEISGSSAMVFYVENFDILKPVEDNLVFGICSPYEVCKQIEVLDVVFVIDSSGSIDFDEYNVMKTFIIDLVKKANVGKNLVQFGALKYSDSPEVLFNLNEFSTKSEIISFIQNDQPRGGSTYTAQALAHSTHLFSESLGSRMHIGVPQVLIVITDGESHDADLLNATAKALRDKGILVLAVGIEGANREELLAMAGSADRYFFVENFEGLKGIFENVSASVCNTSKVDCELEMADLVFLIDGSTSILEKDFKVMKDFLVTVVDDFDIRPGKVHVGIAQFSHEYRPEFSLIPFRDKREVKNQIGKIQQVFGNTLIGAALRNVGSYFRPDFGSRINAGVQQVLLVVTDGQSQDEVAKAAEDLRNKRIDIYCLGVGQVDDQQLIQISGSAKKKLTVDNFHELDKIKKRVVRDVCTSGGESSCFVDVVIGFDISSQKVGHSLFQGQPWLESSLSSVLRAITSLSSVSCKVGSQTQVSVAFQVKDPQKRSLSKLQIYSESIMTDLKQVVIVEPTQLNEAFLDLLWDSFQNKSASRGKVLLLFSDGLDDDVEKLEQKSDKLRREGLNALITVALEGASGSRDLDELLYIEFGKGFEYRTRLTLGMRDLDSRLSRHLANVAERTCCCLLCKCSGGNGLSGELGKPGKKGHPGFKGSEGYLGEEGEIGERGVHGPIGEQGPKGCSGTQGPKGDRGLLGEKGEAGDGGIDGLSGEQGYYGLPGRKGEKGDDGSQGNPGFGGLPGDRGQKGIRGEPGNPGLDSDVKGPQGSKGERGTQGTRGQPGEPGIPGSRGNHALSGRRGHAGPQGGIGARGLDGQKGARGLKGPQGPKGVSGVKGERGNLGNKGQQGPSGPVGAKGSPGSLGPRGNKGEPGESGERGGRGLPGQRGMRGEDGNVGYGGVGKKGSKGKEGFPGDSGPKGKAGDVGIPGEPGPKGYEGRTGSVGLPGEPGSPGTVGPSGRRGVKGAKGRTSFSSCSLLQYVRDHSPASQEKSRCPVHPTELAFALDLSRGVTEQSFERMKDMILSIVNDTKIRESNCPAGTRVAVVSYDSNIRHHIRLTDSPTKNQLLREIKAIPYGSSSNGREIGKAMRFVAKNVFKRTLRGPLVRKVTTVFSHGPSSDLSSITTATLEFSALDIIPVVIAFSNMPAVKKAFMIDDTGTFQVITVPPESDYKPVLKRLQRCTFCYDKCRPDASCEQDRPFPGQSYIDAALLFEGSRNAGRAEFEEVKGLLSVLFDNFDVATEPLTSATGDRVAVLGLSPPSFAPNTQESPVKTEFNFTTYNSKLLMKRHIQKSVRPLDGDVFVGHALQWTVNNLFRRTPNPRKYKVIFVISAGETSPRDKEALKIESLRAKCRGYAIFVFSLGPIHNATELEELASHPLDHHLLQLGRVHKPDHGYGVKFIKSFINSIRREINKYPPNHFRTKCAQLSSDLKLPLKQQNTLLVRGSHGSAFRKSGIRNAKLVS
ncbi:collagen alpha-6(VI) chain-like [Tachyglossus aculeatus]|uniref:collagen alpha-6(VI) chain-like n=1 Tax=Tachyglossus aculeatus TaxID=9261 RepID=UPI0018F57B23|nr:collagen alpha-6(VI) chain-like [Tachyglossus aculeatus]